MLFNALFVSLSALQLTVTANQNLTLDFSKSDAFTYLERFGYIDKSKDYTESDDIIPGTPAINPSNGDTYRESLIKFQESSGLRVTGELDDDTKRLMLTPRCGVGFAQEFRLSTPKWNKKILTYSIVQYSSRVSRADVDRTVRQAMDFWERAADIKFVKSSGKVDIEIKFGRREHGDGISFDGPFGVLAHAFFPSRSPLAGDAHFDDAENWSVRDYVGMQLLQTTTHELGHSLGLTHSKARGSVMYLAYPGWNPNMKLHRDDVRRIQALYGKPAALSPGGLPPAAGGNTECTCQDYTRIDPRTGKRYGNCATFYKGRRWCYVSRGGSCPDAKTSSKVNKDWSWDACRARRPRIQNTVPEKCKCNGMTRYDVKMAQTAGQCLTEYQGKFWCYVEAYSKCQDKKGTRRNKDGMRYWSAKACQIQTRFQEFNTDLDSTKIVFPDEEIP